MSRSKVGRSEVGRAGRALDACRRLNTTTIHRSDEYFPPGSLVVKEGGKFDGEAAVEAGKVVVSATYGPPAYRRANAYPRLSRDVTELVKQAVAEGRCLDVTNEVMGGDPLEVSGSGWPEMLLLLATVIELLQLKSSPN